VLFRTVVRNHRWALSLLIRFLLYWVDVPCLANAVSA
jgi:hypothetical protein